jgi:poly(3-hydroxybutyrate) depolymerase
MSMLIVPDHPPLMKNINQKVSLLSSVFLLCFLILCSSPVSAQERPTNQIVKESIVSNKKKRTYYLFVPANAKAPAPLIVLLHGSGRGGMSLVEKWKDLASKEGVIIVGPDSDSGGGWSTPKDGPDFLHELVEELRSKYPINARRVYLFGHSGGAVFALMMAAVESEYFAAAAIHAGAFRTPDEYKVISQATRKIPLAIWVGTNDAFFNLKDVRATRDAFRSKGFTIEVTEIPGHTHWYYDLAPSINQSAFEFLQKYELTSDPRYLPYAGPGPVGDANKLIQEINALTKRAQETVQRTNEKEKELAAKDSVYDRAQILRIAQEQIGYFEEAASLYRAGADKAESAGSLGLPARPKQYFALIAQYNRKCAELMDVMRERAEALLSTGSPEATEAKREAAQKRADKLQEEINALQNAIDKVMR